MSVRMNASLFSDLVRLERGDYLSFRCETLSQLRGDVQRFFFGVYYPRWHGFYLEELRSVIGNMGYKEYKHFPAFPFDVYTKENGETYVTDDFFVDNIIVIGPPQNQRDDDGKPRRFKITEVDTTHLRTFTGKPMAGGTMRLLQSENSNSTGGPLGSTAGGKSVKGNFVMENSSKANKNTFLTSHGTRLDVELPAEVQDLLVELRNAYVMYQGGGIPEIGIKAMGRHCRSVDTSGHRFLTKDKLFKLVRDSRAFGLTPSLSDTRQSRQSIQEVTDLIFDAFPKEEDFNDTTNNAAVTREPAIDYDVFMDYIRGEMSAERKKAVWNVFRELDYDDDGYIKIQDIQAKYNAQQHPVVVADKIFSADKLLKGFLTLWDENNKNYGLVSYAEFLDYYNGLSAVIEKDDVFFSILQTTWKLVPWGTAGKLI